MSSRFPQSFLSPRRRVALIENGALTHTSPTYLASPAHYHANSSQQTGPTMEIVDDYIEYVDPVLRTPLPVLPPQMLPPYHHGMSKLSVSYMARFFYISRLYHGWLNS